MHSVCGDLSHMTSLSDVLLPKALPIHLKARYDEAIRTAKTVIPTGLVPTLRQAASLISEQTHHLRGRSRIRSAVLECWEIVRDEALPHRDKNDHPHLLHFRMIMDDNPLIA